MLFFHFAGKEKTLLTEKEEINFILSTKTNFSESKRQKKQMAKFQSLFSKSLDPGLNEEYCQ